MFSSNTKIEFWTRLIQYGSSKLPESRQVSGAVLPNGLVLTVEIDETGVCALTGRSVHLKASGFASSLHQHLVRLYGGAPTAFTVVIGHRMLPQQVARREVIDAIDNDRPFVWDGFVCHLMDFEGEGLEHWPQPDWNVFETFEELEAFYYETAKNPENLGVLLRTLIRGEWYYYRRPVQYEMVGEFTNYDSQGNLYISWTNPKGVKHTGYFRKDGSETVNGIFEVSNPLGKLARIRFNAMNQIDANKVNLYSLRFVNYEEEYPVVTQQLKVV